ncbi:haloacid dehalogenase superfamily, subfamily IA, variant 1 with third motif having Dx(3-4)D or Dx(3-4)E [Gulbenkiania indica]|uniref:Haloacid dehalogenase superfamily, subfamily IA, variant 1 with third motif having Dx(3-4)D or Dx(3-4)E n=2 Tax=Gulbenkiania TaxID=397456 RepID=A0A0K6GUH0_9NEIS|nr:HAD-IA family hydrolase [Gulbenkiania indica]TCW33813.1 phosphoglycolate phosphatase [Gulbenkiania mobilis]CUA82184.1 haloacid dehalogenase superfamily, subfamily IA, variant 1 with third motif having Dx(3-4)D or Dx(3-4)E [Gulbenkiania indica]
MRHNYDLIVFDWDGTLMDSTAHITRSIQAACADLGLPVPERERASHVIGLKLSDALRYACPTLPAERYEEMVDAFRVHYRATEGQITLFDGVRESLAALKASGVFLAVATGNSRAGLNRLLEATGLGELFDATRTVDECPSKPHPAMLLSLTEQLGVETARTLMVGDTTHDLLMAREARTPAVGVTYGAHPRPQLEACGPLALFDRYRDFSAWLHPNA